MLFIYNVNILRLLDLFFCGTISTIVKLSVIPKKNIFLCSIYMYIYIYKVDVVEWSRALDVRLSEWCCSVTMVWVQIPSREEQKFDSSKI